MAGLSGWPAWKEEREGDRGREGERESKQTNKSLISFQRLVNKPFISLGPPNGHERYASSPSPSCCSALVPSHATLLTINRTRTAGPFDCVIPRSSRVPTLNHRGPSSCRRMQGSASSRLFLYFLFASPTSSTAVCYGLSAALLLGPSSSPHLSPSSSPSSTERRPRPVVPTKYDPSSPSKQGPSSFLATLTVSPLRPLRLAAATRAYHQTSADSPPATRACNLPAAVCSPKVLAFSLLPLWSNPFNGSVPPLPRGRGRLSQSSCCCQHAFHLYECIKYASLGQSSGHITLCTRRTGKSQHGCTM